MGKSPDPNFFRTTPNPIQLYVQFVGVFLFYFDLAEPLAAVVAAGLWGGAHGGVGILPPWRRDLGAGAASCCY